LCKWGCVIDENPIKKMEKRGKDHTGYGQSYAAKFLIGFTCESWDTELEREWWLYFSRQSPNKIFDWFYL